MKKTGNAPESARKSIGGTAHGGRNSKVDYKRKSALKMKSTTITTKAEV